MSDARPEFIRAHLQESAAAKQRTADLCIDAIVAAADRITAAFCNSGKLLLCGNGGSAADCQHLAAEFTNRLSADFTRPGLPALALTTDTSFLTAFANDFKFEGVFARQVETFGKPGDVLLGISTSGQSKNVIRAIELANSMELSTIALTGPTGPLRDLAQIAICIPCDDPQIVQESHIAVEHIICHLVERAVFRKHGTTRSDADKSAGIGPRVLP